MAQYVLTVARQSLGDKRVLPLARPTMGGEDFSYMLQRAPGCFIFVGSRNEAKGLVYPHHSPRFDFDEQALEHSVRLLEGCALRFLASAPA